MERFELNGNKVIERAKFIIAYVTYMVQIKLIRGMQPIFFIPTSATHTLTNKMYLTRQNFGIFRSFEYSRMQSM